MRTRKEGLNTLRGQLDERARRERDILAEIVVGPVDNGFWEVHGPYSEETRIVAPGQGRQSYRPGEVVLTGMMGTQNDARSIISHAPAGRQGAAEWSFPVSKGAARDTYGIVRADPDELEAGTVAEVVTLYGFGFLESPVDTFEAVVYDADAAAWVTDPLVTIGAATWVKFTEVQVPITVSFSAPAGYAISIEVTRS